MTTTFANNYIDAKKEKENFHSKNLTNICKYLFMVCFLLLFINTSNNIGQNASALSLRSISNLFRSITSGIRPSSEQEVHAKIQTEIHTKFRFNLLISRTRSFIKNFQSFLMDPNRIPKINLKTQSDNKIKTVMLNEYSLIAAYFQNFISSEYLEIFLKTGDLSYFDGFLYEISLSKQKAIINIYLERFKHIGNLFINYKKIIRWFLNAGYTIEEYIKLSQECIEELQIGLKIFFTEIMCIKKKYDKLELRLDMFKEEYQKSSTDLMIRFNRIKTVFQSNKKQVDDILSVLCAELINLQDARCLLKVDNVIVDFKLLNIEYDGFICHKGIRTILLWIKKNLNFHFTLLCKKSENQRQIENIAKRHNKALESLSKRLKQQIKIIEKIYADETMRKCDKKTFCLLKNKRKLKKKKIANEKEFIDVILDGLNMFFIFKIYNKSLADTFTCYLRDGMGNNILARPEDFFHIVTCNYKADKINDEKIRVHEELRNLESESNIFDTKKNEPCKLSVYLKDFAQKTFEIKSLETINKLHLLSLEFDIKLLEIEKLFLEWYFKVLGKNGVDYKGSEKNDLIKLFFNEYIKRQNTLLLKYVEFFNLDKDKYIIKNEDELISFINMDLNMKDFLINENEINTSKHD